MVNNIKINYAYSDIQISVVDDKTKYIKEDLDLTLIVGLKQLKDKGNLMYEYNAFKNFRTEYDLYKSNSLGEIVSIVDNSYEPITVNYKYQTKTDPFGKNIITDKYEMLDSNNNNHNSIKLTLNNINHLIENEMFGDIISSNSSDEITKIINNKLLNFGYNQVIVLNRAGQLIDFNTNLLKFNLNNPVEIECQPSYDGSVNLIINDNINKPKLINSRFTCLENDTYKIIDRKGNNDVNIYDDFRFDVNTSLYKKITKIPKINYLGLSSGGNNKVGNYTFYFTLSDADGNETDFIGESGIVTTHIGNINDPFSIRSGIENDNSNKMIMFSLSNIDASYEHVKVYFSRSSSTETKQELISYGVLDRKYYIKDGFSNITITGFENIIDKTYEDINLSFNQVETVKTQAQCQNMLFLGNVSKLDVPYKELSDLALRFLPRVTQNINIGNIGHDYNDNSKIIDNYEYYNTKNIYKHLGYWDKEIYRLGVKFILNDYSITPVFDIRGKNNLTENIKYIDFPVYIENNDGTISRNYINIDDDFIIRDSESTNVDLENSKGVIRFNSENSVIRDDGVYPIGVKIDIADDVLRELKKITKGFIIVRQKRIPTILTQALTIGLDSNSYLPAIPTNLDNKFIIERFVNDGGQLEHDFDKHIFKFDTGLYEAAISPDSELFDEYYSQMFTGTKFNVSLAKHQPKDRTFFQSRYNNRSFYIPSYTNKNEEDITDNVKITLVRDSVKILTSGTQKFSAKAGEAEEAWRLSYIGKDNTENKTWNKFTSNMVRGLWGSYLGIENLNKLLANIDIHIPDYSIYNMEEYFKIRYDDVEPFYNITDWIDYDNLDNSNITNLNSKSISCYRGDCFVGNFTHRMQRNFQDLETPINDKIVNVNSFKEHFNPNDKDSYKKINRADVNAVQIGHWITSKFCSNINLAMRNTDDSSDVEVGLMGVPKNFVPLYNMSVSGESKMEESKSINVGMNITTSKRITFNLPDVPYIKNEFDVRILYSDIHVSDAFKNSYRNFKATNFKDYPRIYGSIVKLIEWYGSLICVFEHGVVLIPVNERAVATSSEGGNAYINTPNVLPNNPIVLSPTFGSKWADSIIKTQRFIYGLDSISKKIWRTDGKKFENISDFKIQSFINDNISLTVREKTPLIGIRNIKTHFNAFKNDVMFTFYDNLYGIDEKAWNICFNEITNKWTTFYSWIPSYSENINNMMFSFDRETSNIISKLGVSNKLSTFADGIVLDKILIEDTDNEILIDDDIYLKLGKLDIINRNLPNFVNNKMTYFIDYSLDKDNYLNYKSFTILKEGNDSILCYKKDSKFNSSSEPLFLEIRANVKIIDKSNGDLEIKRYIEGYNDFVINNYGYFSNIINIVGRNYLLNDNNLTTHFWKHGKAGIFDIEDRIKPTQWYGKTHPFEFEFIVIDNPLNQKIFDTLKIVSNSAEPDSLHYEVVGDSYVFNNDKQTMYFRQELTKKLFNNLGSNIKYDTDYVSTTNKSLEFPIIKNIKSNIFPLFYQRVTPYDKMYDLYQLMTSPYKDYQNLSGSEIIFDRRNNEYRILTHSKFSDIRKNGIIRGNGEYREDSWSIQIPSINFKQKNELWSDVTNDKNNYGSNVPVIITKVPDDLTIDEIPNNFTVQSDKTWSKLNETKIRDKYLKVKVRYSGEKLAVISAILTIYNTSYA